MFYGDIRVRGEKLGKQSVVQWQRAQVPEPNQLYLITGSTTYQVDHVE